MAASGPQPQPPEALSPPPRAWPLPPGARPATDWPAPREHPLVYPGPAPDHSYLLVEGHVVPLSVGVGGRGELVLRLSPAGAVGGAGAGDGAAGDGAAGGARGGGSELDRVLGDLGAAPLADRVPLLAYGANRGPRSLALKFAQSDRGALAGGGGATVVPVLAAAVVDHDVVASGISLQGFVRGDLTPSPSTRVRVMVALLDPDQLAAIHDSEGVGTGRYDVVEWPGVEVAGTGRRLDVLAYACCRPPFVSPEVGTPLALAAIAATGRRFPALDQAALLGHVLRSTGLAGAVADLAGVRGGDERAVARALARLWGERWWHEHRTGERPFGPGEEAMALVRSAMAAHGLARSTAARLADAGAVLHPEDAYGGSPALRLASRPLR